MTPSRYFLFLILSILCCIHFGFGEENTKFSVVLFLAKTSTSEIYQQDFGIKFLNFIENTRVKHCATGNNADNDAISTFTSPGSDCKELLKSGIYSLISYCRNVIGMTTAIASQENDTFSNGLRFKKSTSEDLEIRYHHPRSLEGRQNAAKLKDAQKFITEPEHTEVFKIRTKRQNEIEEIPSLEGEDLNAKWDIFGIMANIKLTFFGKLLDQNNAGECHSPQVNRNQIFNQLGKVAETCLFDLVKETLANVQESGDSFLMIVLGGYLTEVCDIYSSLMQSVKHVVENTDERNTLIVVTGACPLINQNTDESFSIPVYVRGPPRACSMTFSGQLYDVPYAIKNLLAEINGGNYFGPVTAKRSKRNVLTAKTRRNSINPLTPLYCYIFLCSIFITLISQ